MAEKKASTYTIDEDIRKAFKMECTLNDVEMSDTIAHMMENYIKISQQLRKEQEDEKRQA